MPFLHSRNKPGSVNSLVEKETSNWLETSEYDLNTAQHMLKAGRYIYVIFMCHLSIEKMFKAIVNEETGVLPPKTHDLVYLLSLAKLKPPQHLLDFIGKITGASIVTRYPKELSKLIEAYPEDVAKEYLEGTKEVLQWLREDQRLK